MKRQFLITAAASAAVAFASLAGCTTNSSAGLEATEKSGNTEERVAKTLTALYESVPGSKEIAEKAAGLLVFPRVVDGGVIVGGEYGRGALVVKDALVGNYKVTSLSLGPQAGLQSQSLVLVFLSQDALDRFQKSNGWTAGTDATVAVGRVGANGRLETFSDSGIVAFALTNGGLIAGASVNGTRIWKIAS